MPIVTPLIVAVPLVVAAASACAAAVAGPASRFARDYVAGLAAGAEPAGDASAEDGPPPVVRRRALLGAGPQAALAATACTTTALWALVHHRWADGLVAVPVVALLVVAGSVDAVCHRLPNRLLGAAAAWLGAALVVRAAVGLAAGAAARACAPPARAVLCALGIGGAALILALLPSGLGMGDVKLCALIGLWLGPLGWDVALSGSLAGVILAGLSALVLMAARVVGRRQMIAMGPHLIVGAWLAWILAVRAGA